MALSLCESFPDAVPGLSTGVVRVAVDGPGGKHRHFRALSARHGPQARPSIFIGDSITDLLALQAADVGLIVGQSQRLRQMAMTLGCEVAPLVAYPINGERGLEGKRVLYEAEDWSEIMAALFGVYGARYLMTAPRSEP